MHRFRLFSPDGNDLGPFTTGVPNWKAGEVIPLGRGRSWRVVEVVWTSVPRQRPPLARRARTRTTGTKRAEARREACAFTAVQHIRRSVVARLSFQSATAVDGQELNAGGHELCRSESGRSSDPCS
jgi:hypothetical protein